MLTKNDLQNIENILDRKLEEKLEAKLEEKLETKLEEKLETKLEQKLDQKLKPIKKDLKEIIQIVSHENAMIIRRVKHLEDKTGFHLPIST